MRRTRLTSIALALVLLSSFSFAQKRKPVAPPAAPAQPAGPPPVLTIAVDATEAPKKIFHSRMTIPAAAGDFVLYFPKWIPGEHAPDGPIADTAGTFFTANGKQLAWKRDTLDMFTYHVDVPAGVTSIEA